MEYKEGMKGWPHYRGFGYCLNFDENQIRIKTYIDKKFVYFYNMDDLKIYIDKMLDNGK